MSHRRYQQIAKATESVRPDGALLEVADHGAQIVLIKKDVEVVEPEPDHLLLQLVRRIKITQQRATRRLVRDPGERLLVSLLSCLLPLSVRDRFGFLPLLLELHHQPIERQLHKAHSRDLLCDGGGQRFLSPQLSFQKALGAHVLEVARRGGIWPPRYSVKPL